MGYKISWSKSVDLLIWKDQYIKGNIAMSMS